MTTCRVSPSNFDIADEVMAQFRQPEFAARILARWEDARRRGIADHRRGPG